MKKHFIPLIILTTAAIASLFACGNKSKTQTGSSDSARIVDTMISRTGSVSQSEVFTATVEASIRNNIGAQTPARINRLLVDVGSRVQKGQVLAYMDNTNLTQLKVQLDNRKLDLARAEELYHIGGISKAQWEQAKMAHDIARTQYTNIQDNTILRSPVSGVVTARNYDNGDMYNGQVPVFVVEEISPVKLKINISEQYFGRIALKMPVAVTLDATGDVRYEGYVSLIHPTIDPYTHTFGVEIEVPNKNKEIRPGMYARATIDFGKKSAIMVSDRAIIKQMGSDERFVFVLKDGKAEQRSVRVGRQDSTLYEIVSGLKDGECVITSGASSLTDGQAVKINNKRQAQ